jgi:hypothetical protein
LQRFIKLPDGLVFADPFVALKALYDRSRPLGNRICQLRLTTAGRAFQQKRFVQLGSKEDCVRGHRVHDVTGLSESPAKILHRSKHLWNLPRAPVNLECADLISKQNFGQISGEE